MKSAVRRFSAFLLPLCLSLPTTLQAVDVAGSRDLDIVPRPLDTEIVDYRAPAEQERTYPLGSIRKISGQVRYDGQVLARGQLQSVTYELPPGHTSNDAFEAARQALQARSAELLFWCQARDCGESSLWANQVFGNARLYGADERQAYLLLRLAEPEQDTLVALYAITRGNRRAYLHVEQLAAQAPLGDLLPTAATLMRQLRSSGSLELARLKGDPQDNWVMALARGLNLDSSLRVTLAGAHAEAWREALIAKGVRAARLEVAEAQKPGLRLEVIR
ncbi:DUF4892 domain-containing protein [Pseudomonas sp. DTU_2021_1001937_2_SI_NGA_ILE_001]|uniref:DUF4892 domain-containing protein n=1 Tax=Pseudomonas sp. DTU_2021_1001937_2_SI_NGA_ILE_001 TaxID=3077589 RepID=UPI0028FC15E8|nr:DUF4892 domain-containing protein [Pseudomonas sp. DTU_2021_1001937_2_SI_NGA_ILE_001]WNW10772.1 DUF4892 domain-containing protein [Pseudomonas sp. DTU_2021_1001937_2_SI_NGA_ILE_001]